MNDKYEQLINKCGSMNPIIGNLVKMAKNGDSKSVETFARNMCKEKGIDFDKEFAQFMSKIKR